MSLQQKIERHQQEFQKQREQVVLQVQQLEQQLAQARNTLFAIDGALQAVGIILTPEPEVASAPELKLVEGVTD